MNIQRTYLSSLGDVDTPLPWAEWSAERYGIVTRWLEGATILDPTLGNGNLLESLIVAGSKRGIKPCNLPVQNLFGLDLNDEKVFSFRKRLQERYGVTVPRGNLAVGDLLLGHRDGEKKDCPIKESFQPEGLLPPADILFGNPPWGTFAALPDFYKQGVRDLFLEYGLVSSRRQVLLGNSRVDIAALVLLSAVRNYLKPRGEGVFFLPLSLFFSEGAGEGFRAFKAKEVPFQIQEGVELPTDRVFPQVETRSGLVYLKRDEEHRYPVPFYRFSKESPVTSLKGSGGEAWNAAPVDGERSSWILYRKGTSKPLPLQKIPLPPGAVPRQGVNTCGANELFFFHTLHPDSEETVRAENNTVSIRLPRTFLFPLLTGEAFRAENPTPGKWVFLPYGKEGKPLSSERMANDPLLQDFVETYRERLSSRKGVLIQNWIRKGCLWALLGVGAYSFAPWKIVWEAAGKNRFVPRIFPGEWQANQSMYGFLSFYDLVDAQQVLTALHSPEVEAYLGALNSGGTLNWAQPGRMKRLFQYN
jgi:hypothetical protein